MSRRRKVLQWTRVGLCGLMVVPWIESTRLGIVYGWYRGHGSADQFIIVDGRFVYEPGVGVGHGGVAGWYRYHAMHCIRWGFDNPIGFAVPLWLPVMLLFIASIFPRDRKSAKQWHCMCGYDLTGNISGTCPECGRDVCPTRGSDCRVQSGNATGSTGPNSTRWRGTTTASTRSATGWRLTRVAAAGPMPTGSSGRAAWL